jgi:hypothetical protein
VAGAWRDLVDLGRDLGIPAAGACASAPTRREFAAHAEERGLKEARAVAVAADAAVFGPADPDDAAVSGVWQLVAAARRAATSGLPLRRRVWVAVNPASLWASRATLERMRDAVRSRPPAYPARARPAARARQAVRAGDPAERVQAPRRQGRRVPADLVPVDCAPAHRVPLAGPARTGSPSPEARSYRADFRSRYRSRSPIFRPRLQAVLSSGRALDSVAGGAREGGVDWGTAPGPQGATTSPRVSIFM